MFWKMENNAPQNMHIYSSILQLFCLQLLHLLKKHCERLILQHFPSWRKCSACYSFAHFTKKFFSLLSSLLPVTSSTWWRHTLHQSIVLPTKHCWSWENILSKLWLCLAVAWLLIFTSQLVIQKRSWRIAFSIVKGKTDRGHHFFFLDYFDGAVKCWSSRQFELL